MYTLQYSEKHASGNAQIDQEHQELFNLCNQLFAAQQKFGAQEEVSELLNQLLVHLEEHFAHEERVHRAASYGEAAQHALQHKALLDRSKELITRHHHGMLSFGDLFKFMAVEVVQGHLEEADAEFHRHLKS